MLYTIISERCGLNRQIKADNALLRDLKATVRKLMQAVKNTIPAIAEAMETIRQNVIIFCYQLRSIRTGQRKLKTYISDVKSEMKQYSSLVEQIKEKSKERKSLLAEQKELPFWNVPRKKELTSRIAELTELLEELQSEKAILLHNMECTDGKDVSKVRKKVALMEANLKELDEQEQKYSAELDKALAEYADLKALAADFDPVELYEARQVIRPVQKKEVEQQLEGTMHEKPSLIMLLSAKQETSRLLGEDAENRQARQMIMRRRSTEQLKRSHLKTDRCKIER